MPDKDRIHHDVIMLTIALYSLAFIICGLCAGDITALPRGLWRIWVCPAPLVTDYTAIGGLGPALFNAGLMGLMVWGLFKVSGFTASGGAFGAFFLSLGIGLFGKTPITLLPFLLGGWLYSKHKGEPFNRILLYPLQGAALSPIVSIFMFHGGFSWGTAIAGVLCSMLIGFVITPIAVHTRTMHRGFDLYNVGLAAGLIGICFFAIYKSVYLSPKGLAESYHVLSMLGPERPVFFTVFLGGIFLATALAGWLMDGRKLDGFRALRSHTGLNIDFAPQFGMPAVLMNMGCMGLMMLAYLWVVSAPLNGATVGALMCTLCWTGTGANTRNTLPILFGYAIFSLITNTPLSTQYLCVAICYATGLSPISGKYGAMSGMLAGLLHAFLASSTSAMHGGFNLYNGGFTAGLTAIVLYPAVQALSRHEYADIEERPPAFVAEVASDVVHFAESAVHMVAPNVPLPTIKQEEHEQESKAEAIFLTLRNILALSAALLFMMSVLRDVAPGVSRSTLKFMAYIVGALAYGSEILVLTDGFKRKTRAREMLMPYLFGMLYIVLGLSYLLESH